MNGMDLFEKFVHLNDAQLKASGVPERYWRTLYKKLYGQVFDANNAFAIFNIDYEDQERADEDPGRTIILTLEDGMSVNDPNHIYLIDHAFTFRMNELRCNLSQHPSLIERFCNMMAITYDDESLPRVLRGIWRYCNMYSIKGTGSSDMDYTSIWYVMDEVGSAINHSDSPNFRVVPFMFTASESEAPITYSLMFPLRDCECEEQVTRDFVEGIAKSDLERQALLLPWRYTDFTDESHALSEPGDDYFLDGHIEESLPSLDKLNSENTMKSINKEARLKVYCQYDVARDNLKTSKLFEIVDEEYSADILWLNQHFKKYLEFSELKPNCFVNQFPFENVLTIKDLLAAVSRRAAPEPTESDDDLETKPKWLPTTFNLKTELVQFVSYYQKRDGLSMDNHWIVKPWNLARGMDTHITNDLNKILRLQCTGPKIAQKYIENPVLYSRREIEAKVKFDIRYVILLRSIKPLDVHIYKNFFLRFANKPFELANFDEYERHFTVMNYTNPDELKHVTMTEFLDEWTQQYPEHKWDGIEQKICELVKSVFESAIAKPPPSGIGESPQSRAMYAADIMLSWDNGEMQPKLLEINWAPDCKRACDYYPSFFDDVFRFLFLGEDQSNLFRNVSN